MYNLLVLSFVHNIHDKQKIITFPPKLKWVISRIIWVMYNLNNLNALLKNDENVDIRDIMVYLYNDMKKD